MIIAIAKDEAFDFVYKANIDDLARLGEVVYFSPLNDGELPACDLLYLPGGYPELYAGQLTANTSMRSSIKAYIEGGGLTFAECGGFMYLCHSIDGNEMCGVFNIKASMQNARLHLGYRSFEMNGVKMCGHEFHYSDIVECDLNNGINVLQNQVSANGTPVTTTIYHYKHTLAGYTHWYWAENGFDNTWLKLLEK